MWDFISPINLIRYLIAWRVNGALVYLPRCLSAEISWVLGKTIAEGLPTQQAREWRKALAIKDDSAAQDSSKKSARTTLTSPAAEAAWPIEAVLFPYPGKRTYGQGEVILWELDLLGTGADHGVFLELILPAMEKVAGISDPQLKRANNLWGRFDIQAVYAARGSRWEPVVTDGRLDLHYRASPNQWADGLDFAPRLERPLRHLTWITPFDLGVMPDAPGDAQPSRSARRKNPRGEIPAQEIPTFEGILEALMARMTVFWLGKRHVQPQEMWAQVKPEEQTALWLQLQEAQRRAPLRRHTLEPAPKDWPGRWIGAQTFEAIPDRLVPYLELASILHIGKHTHLGCGTFILDC
jgi:hypothetical protein